MQILYNAIVEYKDNAQQVHCYLCLPPYTSLMLKGLHSPIMVTICLYPSDCSDNCLVWMKRAVAMQQDLLDLQQWFFKSLIVCWSSQREGNRALCIVGLKKMAYCAISFPSLRLCNVALNPNNALLQTFGCISRSAQYVVFWIVDLS